jgi:hypothetical protein
MIHSPACNSRKHKPIIWFVVALVAVCVCVRAEAPVGYKLVWSDDFNGTALDTNLWFIAPASGC